MRSARERSEPGALAPKGGALAACAAGAREEASVSGSARARDRWGALPPYLVKFCTDQIWPLGVVKKPQATWVERVLVMLMKWP